MNLSTPKTLFLDLLFPRLCISCKKEGEFLCEACTKALLADILDASCPVCRFRNRTGRVCRQASCKKKTVLTRFVAAHDYRSPLIRDLIHTYKYNGVRELAEVLGHTLCTALENAGIRFRRDLILAPIPLHPRRERERGFNQALLLAEYLSRKNRVPLFPDVLNRVRYTEPQIELENYEKRKENIKGAFRVTAPQTLSKKIVILVDDVATSRSTLEEAARILKESGAKEVWGAVIAKG